MNKLMTGLMAGTLSIVAVGASHAAAGPPTSGCPTDNRASDQEHGMLLLSVADLTAQGYRAPGIIDDPANGGNGDGVICGVPQGNLTTPRDTQLYFFFDNTFGPAHD